MVKDLKTEKKNKSVKNDKIMQSTLFFFDFLSRLGASKRMPSLSPLASKKSQSLKEEGKDIVKSVKLDSGMSFKVAFAVAVAVI